MSAKEKTTKSTKPATKSTSKVVKAKKASTALFKGGLGKLFVTSSFNSTHATFTNSNGDVVCWSTAGTCGFKGTKRSTPFAATTVIEEGLRKAKGLGLNTLEVYLKGPGPGKDSALRVLKTSGLEINLLADTTPVPHNGCRPKKTRRV